MPRTATTALTLGRASAPLPVTDTPAHEVGSRPGKAPRWDR
ncbi:MAG: hypothetical protein ACRDQ4_08640 [Pseudonocardiaceae bacterium]